MRPAVICDHSPNRSRTRELPARKRQPVSPQNEKSLSSESGKNKNVFAVFGPFFQTSSADEKISSVRVFQNL